MTASTLINRSYGCFPPFLSLKNHSLWKCIVWQEWHAAWIYGSIPSVRLPPTKPLPSRVTTRQSFPEDKHAPEAEAQLDQFTDPGPESEQSSSSSSEDEEAAILVKNDSPGDSSVIETTSEYGADEEPPPWRNHAKKLRAEYVMNAATGDIVKNDVGPREEVRLQACVATSMRRVELFFCLRGV